MEELIVKIINQSGNPMPSYGAKDSAGMDIRANIKEQMVLKPLERTLIKTGLYLELPRGYEAQIRPRSGMALKKGITVLNTPGTIDADYRGEIGIILINLSNEEHTIIHGDRIAQMVISKVEQPILDEVSILNTSERGSGGFGSTGFN